MDESGPAGSHTDEQLRMLRTRLYNRERQLVRMPAQKSTDQKVAATLTVMAASARSATGPVCYVCRRDGIFDQTRPPAIPPPQSGLASAASRTFSIFADGTWPRFRQRCRQVDCG